MPILKKNSPPKLYSLGSIVLGLWNDRILNTLSPQSFEEIDIHFGYHPTTDNNGDINNWRSLGLNYTFNKNDRLYHENTHIK